MPNFLPGTRTARIPGVEHQYEFNGLTLNDRTVADRYQITRVTGFEDPDIRDAREVNPGYHGETAFSMYYGGRTIVLEGNIRAGNLEKMRDMQQALKTAALPTTEFALYIRNPQSAARDTYVMVRKSASLQGSEQQVGYSWVRPFQITFRASDPRIQAVTTTTTTYSFTGSPPANYTDYFGTDVADIVSGPYTEIGTAASPAHASGGTVNPNVWSNNHLLSYDTSNFINYITSLSALATLGHSIHTVDVGTMSVIGKIIDSSNFIIATFHKATASTSPSGGARLQILKRVAGTPTVLVTTDSFGLATYNDTLTLRLTQLNNALVAEVITGKLSTGLGTTLMTASYTLAGGDATQFGTGVSKKVGFGFYGESAGGYSTGFFKDFDDFSAKDLDASSISNLTVTNSGNFVAPAVIRFTGPLDSPSIQDSVTGKILAINGAITSGDYVEVDLSTGYAVNSSGISATHMIDDGTSSLPGIEPGTRTFTVRTNTWVAGTSTITVTFHSSWV